MGHAQSSAGRGGLPGEPSCESGERPTSCWLLTLSIQGWQEQAASSWEDVGEGVQSKERHVKCADLPAVAQNNFTYWKTKRN